METGDMKITPARSSSYWSRRVTPGKVIIYLVLGLIFFITFYPFFYVLSLAVMPYDKFVSSAVHAWPNGFTLLYFQQILKDPNLPHSFLVSIGRTIIGTVIDVVATAMAGYALSRHNLKYRNILTFLFLIPMYFSAGIIPYYLAIRATGLTNTFWVLILPGLVAPLWLFVSRASFAAYPEEIIEAATIDGAGQFRIFWNIIWPTSYPLIATLAVMYGTGHWNEYFFSRILVGQNLWPATVQLYNIINTRSVLQGLGVGIRLEPQSYLAAMASMLIIPILVIYPLLQRYVVVGMTAGALKE
jgi:putative aldouronate transport system permease protein